MEHKKKKRNIFSLVAKIAVFYVLSFASIAYGSVLFVLQGAIWLKVTTVLVYVGAVLAGFFCLPVLWGILGLFAICQVYLTYICVRNEMRKEKCISNYREDRASGQKAEISFEGMDHSDAYATYEKLMVLCRKEGGGLAEVKQLTEAYYTYVNKR